MTVQFLTSKKYKNRHSASVQAIYKQKHFLRIAINNWQYQAIGKVIIPESAYWINKMLERAFDYELYRFCDVFVLLKPKEYGNEHGYKEALHYFAEHYGITLYDDHNEKADISFEALKKKEWRFRDRISKANDNGKSGSSALSDS